MSSAEKKEAPKSSSTPPSGCSGGGCPFLNQIKDFIKSIVPASLDERAILAIHGVILAGVIALGVYCYQQYFQQ